MIIIAIIELSLTIILSSNYFSFINYITLNINNTINQYNKNEIIYYTKTFWEWNWIYCLNKKTFDFNKCNIQEFIRNRLLLTFVNTNNNLLKYKNGKSIITINLK